MPTLDLNNTFGALLIGVFFSAALFGVTCTQIFFYFQNYDSDGFIIKASVVTLLILETLHSAFGIHAMYYYTILNYLNPVALVEATWSATMTLGISTGIILVVHLFYTRRVYYLSRKNIPLTILITALALAHFGTSVAVSARAFQLKFYAAFANITHLVDTSLALAVVTDVVTAASLSYYLHTSRSGVESTDTLINKLMAYAINNGILTSVFDIIVLAFVTTEVDNLIFLAIFQVVGNLYTNSMMATLNSRRSLYQASRPAVPVGSNNVTMNTFRVAAGTSTAVSAAESEGTEFDRENKHQLVKITSTKNIQIV